MKVKHEPKNRKAVIVPIGMCGAELKQLKLFDKDQYQKMAQRPKH